MPPVLKLDYDPNTLQIKTTNGFDVMLDDESGLKKTHVSFENGNALIQTNKPQDLSPQGFGPEIKDHNIPAPDRDIFDHYDNLAKLLSKDPSKTDPTELREAVLATLVKIDEARHHPMTANKQITKSGDDQSFAFKTSANDAVHMRHADPSFAAAAAATAQKLSDGLHKVVQNSPDHKIDSADRFFKHLIDTRTQGKSGLIYNFNHGNPKKPIELRVKPEEFTQRTGMQKFLENSKKMALNAGKYAIKATEVTARASVAIANNTMEIAMAELGGGKVNPRDLMPVSFNSQLFVKGLAVPAAITTEEFVKTCAAFEEVLNNSQTYDKQGIPTGWDTRKIEIMESIAQKMQTYERILRDEAKAALMYRDGHDMRKYWEQQRTLFEKAFIDSAVTSEEERYTRMLFKTARNNGPIYRKFFENSMIGTPIKDVLETKILNSSKYI